LKIIGFQLFIEGKKRDDIVETNQRHAEIPSRINRAFQASVCAITNNPQCPRSKIICYNNTNIKSRSYYVLQQ
jgi:hypothetical protein